MNRYLRMVAAVGVFALVAAACGRGDTTGGAGDGAVGEIPRGGTLVMQMVSDVTNTFDAQKEYASWSWEFFRCCIARNLLSNNGQDTEGGGEELHPDLAVAQPEVSEDGLTYTFMMKQGIMWGPPLEDREITVHDIVRALEREADPAGSAGGYSFYFSIIDGFDDFGAGEADSISGLTAIDDYTLEVRLNKPAGYILNLLAMPASAPIPEELAAKDKFLLRNNGRFWVSSGPYMFEGSENLDFSGTPKDWEPVAGYEPGRSLVLVRNPSWDAATDELRPAYVDRIEATIGGTDEDAMNKIDLGEIDLAYTTGATPEAIEQYSTDPALEDRLFINSEDATSYISMNVAVPPFDDLAVRRAVNWVVNKDALLRIAGGPLQGEIAGHYFPNAITGNLLKDYDGFATPNGQGDVDMAKEEMSQSKYDTDGDGSCDADACKGILTISEESADSQRRVSVIEDGLKQIGITIDNKPLELGPMYAKCNEPAEQVALCTNVGWIKDFTDGASWVPPLFGSEGLFPGCCNYSVTSASPEQLEEWGYTDKYGITEVPDVDGRSEECDALTGQERIACWAEVDRWLTEEVAAWVPVRFTNSVFVVSEFVVNYTFDQFATMPSLDNIAVDRGEAAA